jgi:hypothetical protein
MTLSPGAKVQPNLSTLRSPALYPSVSFRARVVERDVIVLNNGLAMIE